MKDGKITLERAKNCYKPCRLKPSDGKRYLASQEFYDFNGFHFEEMWNLDAEICYFILVRLVNYRDMSWGVPGCFLQNYGWHSNQITERKAKEHWNSVLNKMIRGFYLYLVKDFPTPKEQKIIAKGMKLFTEFYSCLWD